ncbi:bifunctional precorrin-2 dehydrogenase/sirohydrochlorin ferrochelatase [Balneolaceae bacterium ANBcel3]|nr:bifunctional precorrin-2 dehydrogenase/sirohydrochlorin ferrochelatase [Balneolaceae bacterium ANBcel3]
MSFYPVYLTRLDEKPVVLFGGDEEAERKTRELIDFGCRIRVIRKTITGSMMEWHEQNLFNWIPRDYEEGDLADAGFVIVAEGPADMLEHISKEAMDRNLLINVMDNIPLSNAAFGSVIRQGPLTVSFSTNGLAPALAVRLKERFQQEIDDAYAEFLELSRLLRPYIMEYISDPDERKRKWYAWVDSETLPLLRNGERAQALDVTERIWGKTILRAALPEERSTYIKRLFGWMASFLKTG